MKTIHKINRDKKNRYKIKMKSILTYQGLINLSKRLGFKIKESCNPLAFNTVYFCDIDINRNNNYDLRINSDLNKLHLKEYYDLIISKINK